MDIVLRKEMKPKVPILYMYICICVCVCVCVCIHACIYTYTQQECIQNDKISSLPITLVDLSEKEKSLGGNLGWQSQQPTSEQ